MNTLTNNIAKLRKQRGMTQVELAKAVGFSVQTVSAAENGKTGLSPAKLKRYADVLGKKPDEVIAPANEERMVVVRGFAQTGHWAETWELPKKDRYEVPIRKDDPHFWQLEIFAAETRGKSMNQRFPEGTVIILSDATANKEDWEVGAYYFVERQRADGLSEATVKRLQRLDDGSLWLMHESDDPRQQQSFPIAADRLRMIGRVRSAILYF